MPSNQSKEVSDHTAFENSSLQRSRAMSKLLCGGQQYIEKGYLSLINYTVTAGGKLRKIGDNSTFSLLDTEVDKLMLSKSTRSMVSGGKQLKMIDSKDVQSTLSPNNHKYSSTFFLCFPTG